MSTFIVEQGDSIVDGFSWRNMKVDAQKNKTVTYYQCKAEKCEAKKKVMEFAGGATKVVLYGEQHNHPLPGTTSDVPKPQPIPLLKETKKQIMVRIPISEFKQLLLFSFYFLKERKLFSRTTCWRSEARPCLTIYVGSHSSLNEPAEVSERPCEQISEARTEQ